MYKAKIIVVGPCEAGKTVISNFLSDATESSGGEYHPTQGCRILEFEVNNVVLEGRSVNAEIELWDISGDHKFEGCWPTISKDTNGVIFVFNPDQSNHDKELEAWYAYFVDHQGLRTAQCVAFAHYKNTVNSGDPPPLPSQMNKITVVNTNIDDDGDALRQEFSNYLATLFMTMYDKREQEEISILNG